MRIRSSFSSVLLVLAAALVACGGDAGVKTPTTPNGGGSPAAVLASLNFDAPSSSITIGGTVQVALSPRDQYGNVIAATVTWSSLNDTVATVTGAGLVTGARAGNALISGTARAGSVTLSQSIGINVMPRFAGPPAPRNVLVNHPRPESHPNIAQFEPTIAVSGSRIVVGWNDESLSLPTTVLGVKWSVGYGYSTDGGSTFTDAGELGFSHWGADPTVAVDRAGNFYLSRLDLGADGVAGRDRVSIFKSTDPGVTFSQVATVTGASPAAPLGIDDGPKIAADNTGGKFDGNVYASWTFSTNNQPALLFSRSTDGGHTYSTPIVLSDRGSSLPAVGPRGEVYLLSANELGLTLRTSIDGGVSFGPALPVARTLPIGAREPATSQYCGAVLHGNVRAGVEPMIAVDRSGGPNNGRLYVVFSSVGERDADLADVFITASGDAGATWSTPRRLNDDLSTNDQWRPFVVVAPDGTVAVSWYDRRQDPQNLLIDVFMRISTDGGASFGPNLKITEVAFPPRGLNLNLGFPPYSCYLGAYNFMTADDRSFYIVWTDNRMVTAGAVDPNIMFAKVPH